MPHLPKCQPFIPLKLHSVSVTASRPTGLANRHYVKFRSVAGLVSQLPRPPRALQPRHKLWHTTVFYSQRALRVCSLRSFAPPTPAAAGASRLCRVWAWAYPSAPKGLPYTQALAILQRGGFVTIAPAARARIPLGLALNPSLFRADCAAQPLVGKGQALRVDKPRQLVATLCRLVTRFLKP
jgi:hypothetical protein